jgi:hypothetical protein
VAKFKGTIYVSARLFAEQRFGPEAVPRVLAALSPQDREMLTYVAPVGWYPVEPIMAFHRELDRLYGKGDLALCVELGKFSAEWALSTILKLFVRFTSPSWLIERSAALWGRYHDSGRWEHAPTEAFPIQSRLYDFEVRDPAFCARFRGWLARATELTGGKEPEVTEPKCACRGDKYCEFRVRWS